jgi:hypothetical protein
LSYGERDAQKYFKEKNKTSLELVREVLIEYKEWFKT